MKPNGSTSQASVCASTLALMDAGVPIKRPVGGVAMGLIKDEATGKIAVLTDIQGLEGLPGRHGLQGGGTALGITAIQMDIKIKGIDEAVLRQALSQALDGRMHILGKMLEALPAPRPGPVQVRAQDHRVQDQSGEDRRGGRPPRQDINKIIEQTGVKIDIEDDGSVYIATSDEQAAKKAQKIIEGITKELQLGDEFEGTVVRIMPFGAFLEYAPGKDGMLHISKLANERVEKVEDVINIGDTLPVKVAEIDGQGRVNLIRSDIEYDNPSMPVRRPPRRDGGSLQGVRHHLSGGSGTARFPRAFQDSLAYDQHASNGLRIVAEKIPHFRSVSAGLDPERLRYETRDQGGISHFIEHMLFKGTKRRPPATSPRRWTPWAGSCARLPPRNAPAFTRRWWTSTCRWPSM